MCGVFFFTQADQPKNRCTAEPPGQGVRIRIFLANFIWHVISRFGQPRTSHAEIHCPLMLTIAFLVVVITITLVSMTYR